MPVDRPSRNDRDEFLIITINHSYAGFFAYVNFALNQLIYAGQHGLRPVVRFGPRSGDGPNAFYDPRRGENIWDYYFEPVEDLTYADIEAKIDDVEDALTFSDLTTLTVDELWKIHCEEPRSIFPYPHSMHYHREIDVEWYAEQRARANEVIQRHVRVKSHILDKVDLFERDHFAGTGVLGIHMRGTDKGTAHAPPSLMRVVKPEEYFPHIDAYTDEKGPCKIFVATEQQQFLDQMTARYGDRVVSYQAVRTSGIRNPFELEGGNGYRKGEDVLIDCLLLSRCDFLLKCTSAVGEFAMYFNPKLACVDLNHLAKRIPLSTLLFVRLKRLFYFRYLGLKNLVRRLRERR